MTETRPDTPGSATNSLEVSFDGGCIGCLFVFFVPSAVVCAIAAVDSALVASLAETEARRNVFAAIAPFRVGGINIGALVLAGVLGWEAVRLARRFLSDKAVWIEGDMIRFHPTVRRRPLSLWALERITHESGDIKSILVLEHSGGARVRIYAVDPDAAAAFVAEAERAKAALTFG